MNRKCGPILLFLLLLMFVRLSAQVNDAGVWMSANLEKKITPAVSVFFTEEIRMNENITEVGSILSDLGIRLQPWKRLKIGGAYRFSLKRRLDETYGRFHSWYCEASYREKIKPISITLRLRYQSKYSEIGTDDQAGTVKSHFRSRLLLKYDTDRKIDPYIYTEFFFRLNAPAKPSFDQFRGCAGLEYSINRMHKIDLHYLIRMECQVNNPETDYIIGISYYLSF